MEQLERLTADSLVLALSYSLDREGQVINHEKISRLLSQASPVPVYGLHEERLGFGIVGGGSFLAVNFRGPGRQSSRHGSWGESPRPGSRRHEKPDATDVRL